MSDPESARTVGGSSAAAGEDPMRGLRHRMEVCDDNVAKLYLNCVRTSGDSSDVALPPDSPLVIEPERPAVRVAWEQMKQALTLPSTPGA